MLSSVPRSFVPLALASAISLLTFNQNAQAQSSNYQGIGSVNDLDQTGTSQAPAADSKYVVMLDLAGDGKQDLLILDDQDRISYNPDAAEYFGRKLTPGYSAMAASRSFGDQLWAVSGTTLVQVQASDLLGSTQPLPLVSVSINNPTHFEIQERPGGSYLTVIDAGGSRARILLLTDGGNTWTVQLDLAPTPPEQSFRDLALVNWSRLQEGFCTLTDQGLKVFEGFDTQNKVVDISLTSADAFIEVMPASGTQFGHDLLFYYLRPIPSSAPQVLVCNSSHVEWLYPGETQLTGLHFADFSPEAGLEFVMPRGDLPGAILLTQLVNQNESQPIFTPAQSINLAVEKSVAGIQSAPLTTSGDLDSDGHQDLIFIDSNEQAIFILSESTDENGQQLSYLVEPDLTIVREGADFELDLIVTLDTKPILNPLGYEVWYQANQSETLTFIEDGSLSMGISFQRTIPLTFDPRPGIFQLIFRDTSAQRDYLPRVDYWAENPLNHPLFDQNPFPWRPFFPNDDGGTSKRPRIRPVSIPLVRR